MSDTGDGPVRDTTASFGLPTRAEPDPETLAVLAVAAWEAWPKPVVVAPAPAEAPYLAWRFAARWWAKPEAVRRERPWARR